MEKYCWHINHETKLPDTIPEITSKFKCNYTNWCWSCYNFWLRF